MHEAQQANPFVLPSILLNRELEAVNSEVLRARGIRETLTNNPALLNQRDKWVAGLFAPMLQRMERSADLLDGAELDDDSLAVSHRRLRKKNWRLLDGKLFLHGFYRPTLSVQLCDVACFLREIYTETGDVKRVEAFLDGYETVKPLTYGE
ncbi:hypothetical protein MXD63_38950, partial [Frankia sp. Cpl3]|nr:hypothetical protein [Frankia sp. Cpl3]